MLGVILVVCMITSVAFATSWVCPNCQTVNIGNYCSHCGTKRPETSASDTRITNVRLSTRSNGDVLVRWDDSSDASSYTVTYTTEDWDVHYTVDDRISGNQAILKFVIPGLTYQVTVSNGTSKATENYTVPDPLFREFDVGEKYMALTRESFSLGAMEHDQMLAFQVQIRYPQLRYSREYTAKLVLETPYGYCSKVTRWDSYTLENQYSYVYSSYYMMSDWLEYVEDTFGSIPTGKYTFKMYMDGQLYAYKSFRVTQ